MVLSVLLHYISYSSRFVDSQVFYFFSVLGIVAFFTAFSSSTSLVCIGLFLHFLFTLLYHLQKNGISISAFPIFILYFLFILSCNLFYYDLQ